MSILSYRNSFKDYDHVASVCRFQSVHREQNPRASIVIPTFRRPDLLLKTIQSAINQTSNITYEIVVVDNDPDTYEFSELENSLNAIPDIDIKYYVNQENIGMFGNWNRCIELARGDWVTILNDDDALHPTYLNRIFSVIDSSPFNIDGITCRQNEFYRDRDLYVPDLSSYRERIRLFIRGMRFNSQGIMRVTANKLFFGNDLRNSLGFIFRKAAAMKIGGFKPDDFPASDFFFYVRFAVSHDLYWFHETLASIGIGDNESMNIDTSMRYVYQCAELRREMAGTVVPKSWITMNPQLTAYAIANMEKVWGISLDWHAAEKNLAFSLPKPSINNVRLLRLKHGVY